MTSPSQKSVGDFIEGRRIINTEAPRFELEEAPAHWKQSNPPADAIHIQGRILLLRLEEEDWAAACCVPHHALAPSEQR